MRGFGDLEAVIMHQVWERGEPVTVRDLFDDLAAQRTIAYTTVMSTMDNLHRKGWLDRVRDGKAYRYTATASREEYSARLMREALADGGVFGSANRFTDGFGCCGIAGAFGSRVMSL